MKIIYKMIQKLIELTLNWKYRNMLHLFAGILICLPINLLLNLTSITELGFFANFIIRGIISYTLMKYLGDLWEQEQVKHYNAEYSDSDVNKGIIGGIIISLIFSLI